MHERQQMLSVQNQTEQCVVTGGCCKPMYHHKNSLIDIKALGTFAW